MDAMVFGSLYVSALVLALWYLWVSLHVYVDVLE